ncbi:splicing factor 3A subunit 1, partial [Tremellales sp. Uapishka_1]
MALNLPKPVNTYAGEDELRTKTNGTAINGNGADENGHDDEDIGEYRPPRASDKLKEGIIYPPKEIRNIVDKTAVHISKSPTPDLLESKIREHQKSDPKFAFLNDADPYHQYYRYMIEKVREDAEDVAKGISVPVPEAVKEEVPENTSTGYEPKAWEFKIDLPGVTAMDLDILRLTALFHARRGRSFLSSLSVREGRNYQFDFLRPTHSLYGYYNRMVESYEKVLNPLAGEVEKLSLVARDPETKWKTLEEARNRAEWERGKRKRENERSKEKEEEEKAFAAIDWQDFVVVETIEFTQNDMELELPPPTNIEKLKTMSMAERRMATMVMEETGAGQVPEAPVEEMEIEEDEDEESRLQRIKAEAEQAKAREVQRSAMESRGLKIKSNYVPKAKVTNVQTAKCPYCNQSIPESELSEHIRIELLDPKWKEQKRNLDLRKAQHQQLQQGADISASLRNLASQRTDLFGDELDEEERKRKDEEDKLRRKEREKIVWDGHTASKATTESTFQSNFSLDNQIRDIHNRVGVAATSGPSAGPQIGPGIPSQLPPALAASLPMPGGGTAYPGAMISAAPTGPTVHQYISAPYEPPPSAPSIHPSRLAAMGAGAPPPVAGQVRPYEGDEPERPVFKRPKIEKLPYGQLYTEIDWMSLHPDPIALSVQLPNMPDKPEWKLDGSIITIPDLPVNTLFSTVRERIKRVVDADLPISRLRLDYGTKVLSNSATLASVNLDTGDLLTMIVKKK